MQRLDYDEAAIYRITVSGRLDPEWSGRLCDLTITNETRPDSKQATTLYGPLMDQAAVSGVLHALYDLGLTLLSVEQLAD